jgi:hypothetical protein
VYAGRIEEFFLTHKIQTLGNHPKKRIKILISKTERPRACLFLTTSKCQCLFMFIIKFVNTSVINSGSIPLICDKSVTTQNLAFLSYWYRKETFANTHLTRVVS